MERLRKYDQMSEKQVTKLKNKFLKDEAKRKREGFISKHFKPKDKKAKKVTAEDFKNERAVQKLQHRWRVRRDQKQSAEVLGKMHLSATLAQKYARGRRVRQGLVQSWRGRAQAHSKHLDVMKRDAAAKIIERAARRRRSH